MKAYFSFDARRNLHAEVELLRLEYRVFVDAAPVAGFVGNLPRRQPYHGTDLVRRHTLRVVRIGGIARGQQRDAVRQIGVVGAGGRQGRIAGRVLHVELLVRAELSGERGVRPGPIALVHLLDAQGQAGQGDLPGRRAAVGVALHLHGGALAPHGGVGERQRHRQQQQHDQHGHTAAIARVRAPGVNVRAPGVSPGMANAERHVPGLTPGARRKAGVRRKILYQSRRGNAGGRFEPPRDARTAKRPEGSHGRIS